MGGELLSVWSRSWKDLWSKFAAAQDIPDDLFTTLVAELLHRPERPIQPVPLPSAYNQDGELIDPSAIEARNHYEKLLFVYEKHAAEYDTAIASEGSARVFFRRQIREIRSELAAISLVEGGFEAIVDNYSDELGARFF
ncbi:hypothetical protein PUR29_11295 [Methylobacterium ajmalii]|uniref:Uncharacterized protein n=1 Tax=Methylobacterium ajmalii TaxID=2738439 RepID=A0ABU9ZSH5_9HYPH